MNNEDLEHTMNCTMQNPCSDDFCTCGLTYRIQLQTEREMHNAWRKRAEQAEGERDQLRARHDALYADSMIAHRWFAEHFGESLNGRDFSDKCPMATDLLLQKLDGLEGERGSLRSLLEEAREALVPFGTAQPPATDGPWFDAGAVIAKIDAARKLGVKPAASGADHA